MNFSYARLEKLGREIMRCIASRQDRTGLVALGLFLALFSFVGAQTSTRKTTEAALAELGEKTGVAVKTEEDARRLCNEERYFSVCIDVGKKYNLYNEERRKQVDEFLGEAKDAVMGELQTCRSEECLLEVAKKLAEKIIKQKPELASQFNLTPDEVKKKEAVVKTAKEVGVSIEECRTMNPDTVSLELLRACARIANEGNIVEGKIDETSIALREALRKGTYQCGDGTLEGCGNFCLNSNPEVRARGNAGIPEVCRRIAETFYGSEGMRSLEAAHEEVQGIQKYFEQKKINKAFLTDDGKKLYEPKEIGRYLEEQGKQGNTEAIRKGMDFLIQHGFAKPEDKEFALKFVENIRRQGRVVDFDACRKNPETCGDIIPDEVRNMFGKGDEALRIVGEEMRKAGVPDPSYCENEEYGSRCAEVSKNALPKIEEMARKSPEILFIVENLRKHVESIGRELEARRKAKEELTKTGKLEIGDRQFTDFNELTEFCSTNGSICLAEAAKKGFIEKDAAAEKYRTAFEIQYRTPVSQRSSFGVITDFSFITSDPYGGYGGTTSPRVVQPTLDKDKKEELVNEFRRWLDNPIGPPPISFGEAGRVSLPYQFQAPQNGTFYYISPEMERCLAERGVQGETIDTIRRGGRVADTKVERAGAECAKDIATGKYSAKEPEIEEILKTEKKEEGILKTLVDPFELIIKTITGGLLQDVVRVEFPYTFSDGFIAKTQREAEAHCKEYPAGSGRGIAAECETKIGVLYKSIK